MENPSAPARPEAFPVGLRVLVVDDDATWLKILEKMLRKCSYEVTTCGLARVALEILRERKNRFDIVISDVNMPDMDGFKLLEHIGLEMDLPVIMMSVDGETSRVMKGVQHGACDYLLKPVRMKELRNIWQHVYRKRMHEIKEIEGHDFSEDLRIIRSGYEGFEDRSILCRGEADAGRKRKEVDNKDNPEEEMNDFNTVKKARVVWSVDLHQKFVNAVNQIGFDKVGPKKILDLMNVPGLTRENVASHLQKYRLYLSRLPKQNEESSCSSKQLDDVHNSSQTQQNNAGSGHVSAQKLQTQGKELDTIEPLQLSDGKTALALASDVPDSQSAKSVSQLGLLLSFNGETPNAEYKSSELGMTKDSKYPPWNEGVPVMQFMQYPKHDRDRCDLLEDYSCLPKPDLEHSGAVDHFYTTSPPVISISCNTEIKAISPLACTAESTFSIDQASNQGLLASPAQDLDLIKSAEMVSFPDDMHLSLQGIGCFENVGLNGIEISNWYDGLEFMYEPADYSFNDGCLFA